MGMGTEAYKILHAGGEAALESAYGVEMAKYLVDQFVEQGKARWTTRYVVEPRPARFPGDVTSVRVAMPMLKTFAKYAR